ncbi:HotDog domain-containing protein [Cryomyces antarcticus]
MALSRRTACSKLLNAIYPARPTQVVARPYRLLDRKLHTTARCSTDGVFRALTESRIETPWIEALRKKQHEDLDPSKPSGKPESPTNRNLEPKKMSDSYHSVVLPLGRDPWLLDTYLNSSGHIRLGAIFMDLDALSGIIAYKHTGDGVTTVTAACDRIIINHPLTEICDLELSGQVTYATGRSSMEISLQAAKAPPEGQRPKNEDVLLTCTFTMVSLDPGTKKPVPINPVKVETEEERQLFEQGEANSKHRKELSQTSLMKHTPNDEESDLIHAMWQRQLHYHDPNDSLRKPNNVHFMDATRLQTASIMQPQYRNRHSFMIFGGFLLKQTFELAFCCVASFAHTRPTFVSLDPSTFQNPVPVGSVLYLTATVTYTDPPLVSGKGDETDSGSKYTRIQVRVDSKVRNVEHGETKPTGQFNYTFTVDKDIKVMPRTYSEFMMYIDARRRARRVTASIKKGEPGTGQPSDPGEKERIIE